VNRRNVFSRNVEELEVVDIVLEAIEDITEEE